MHFFCEEVDARVKSVESKEFHSLANSEKYPIYDYDDLSKDKFRSISRFNVRYQGVTFECLLTPSSTKEMFVFLSGNWKVATKERCTQAMFTRMTWQKYYDGICINIEDPMIKRFPTNTWGGYFGDADHFYAAQVADLVRRFSEVFDVPLEHVTFIGSSSAGWAILHAASLLDGCTCVVENPQIYMEQFTNVDRFIERTGLDIRNNYQERMDVAGAVFHNQNTYYHIFVNRASDIDFSNQLQPFMKNYGVTVIDKDFYCFDKVNIYLTDAPYGERHANWLQPYSVYVMKLLNMATDKRKSFLAAAYQDENREMCRLKWALGNWKWKESQAKKDAEAAKAEAEAAKAEAAHWRAEAERLALPLQRTQMMFNVYRQLESEGKQLKDN